MYRFLQLLCSVIVSSTPVFAAAQTTPPSQPRVIQPKLQTQHGLTATGANPSPSSQASSAQPAPGSSFSVTCNDVTRLVGSTEFSFFCIQPDGAQIVIRSAQYPDIAGSYADANNDVRDGIGDLKTQMGIEGIVTTFMLLKAQTPNATSQLQVDGVYSKLSGTMPVAETVTLIK